MFDYVDQYRLLGEDRMDNCKVISNDVLNKK